MSTDLRNTYYHARLSCVATKHPNFSPGELQVGDVKDSFNLYALNVIQARVWLARVKGLMYTYLLSLH